MSFRSSRISHTMFSMHSIIQSCLAIKYSSCERDSRTCIGQIRSGGVKVDSVPCTVRASHRQRKTLPPVPMTLLKWDSLSISRNIDGLDLFFGVVKYFRPRILLLLQSIRGLVRGNWLRRLRFLCTVEAMWHGTCCGFSTSSVSQVDR